MKKKLIASAETIEALELLINKFYYSSNWKIVEGVAKNDILNKTVGTVKQIKGCYHFYL